MASTGCYNCLRFLIVTVSMLVMIAALCLVTGIIWLVVDTQLNRQYGKGSYTYTVVMLVVGGIVVLIAMTGCCGALTQSRWMVAIICLCLTAMVAGEVTLFVMLAFKVSKNLY
jgi:hypothetical protein